MKTTNNQTKTLKGDCVLGDTLGVEFLKISGSQPLRLQ